jgi:hypothetical protein
MSFDGSIHSVLLDFPAQTAPTQASDDSQNGTDSFLFRRLVALIPGSRKRIDRRKDTTRSWTSTQKFLTLLLNSGYSALSCGTARTSSLWSCV